MRMYKMFLAAICCFLLQPNLYAGFKRLVIGPKAQMRQRISKLSDVRVVERSEVYDRSGKMIGRIKHNGEFVGLSGNVIGTVTSDGRILDIQTKTELVFAGNLGSAKERRAYVYGLTKSAFDSACVENVEQAVAIYFDKNDVLRSVRVDRGDGTGESTTLNDEKLRRIEKDKGTVMAIIHDHPVGGCGSWPSNLDAKAMAGVRDYLKHDVDFYIADCRSVNGQEEVQLLTMLSSGDGKVYDVRADGHVTESRVSPAGCSVGEEGHAAYDPGKDFGHGIAVNKSPENGSKTTLGASAAKDGGKDGEVGIRGWCKCKEKQETSGARSIMVGADESFGTAPLVSRYAYYFCLRCGRCRRPKLDPDNLFIFDNLLELKLAKARDGLTNHERAEACLGVERKFINIPDGQIVFPGECACKEPDPVHDGFQTANVCVKCGKSCSKTVIGPTAERLMNECR